MKNYILKPLLAFAALIAWSDAQAIDHPKATLPVISSERFTLVEDGRPDPIVVSSTEDKAVLRAAGNLVKDFERVTGNRPAMSETASSDRAIIIGSVDSPIIKDMVARGRFDVSGLQGRNEKYIIQTVTEPMEGIGEALVIAGSDRRGVQQSSLHRFNQLLCAEDLFDKSGLKGA